MSNEQSPGSGPTPENMVSYSEQLLNISIARLTFLLEGNGEPRPGLGKDLAEEFRGLRKALEIAFHERANLQKLKGAEAAARGPELDLDAARAEIGRRLDLIRAARDRGGVS